ncbi:MAG: transporter substrate-binding domain-containing protein, partial [Pseudomonadota bacterium]
MFNKSSHLRRQATTRHPRGARFLAALLVIALSLSVSLPVIALAQTRDVFIPNFWDNSERLQKPDLDQLPRLRFLTTTDFPPFNFIDRKRRLSGFHVDLAREICTQLGVL